MKFFSLPSNRVVTLFLSLICLPLQAEGPLLPMFIIRGFSQKQVAPEQTVEIQGEVSKGVVGSTLSEVYHAEVEIHFAKARFKAKAPRLLIHGTTELSLENLKEARVLFANQKTEVVITPLQPQDLCEVSLIKKTFRCAGAKVTAGGKEASGRSLKITFDKNQMEFLGKFLDPAKKEKPSGSFTL